jgi:EAL domain-containing protein (putative c-di-GMP-specific phosphodiesterase class I)
MVSRTRRVFEAHFANKGHSEQLDPSSFGAILISEEAFDLEVLLNSCTRIQHDLSEPLIHEGVPLRWTVSIGFAGSNRFRAVDGDGLLQAAYAALNEARRKGPNAVRSYSTAMDSRRARQKLLGREAALAFDRGEVFAYFQPQISMHDGRLTGFEALTRWRHPERGLVSPADFLPVLEQAGLMHRLGDTMIAQSLQALQHWDANGLVVPRVGVNFSTDELRDPLLVDRIAMLMDAHDMCAGRLVVEVLETVIAKASDDVIVRNLSDLAALGCGIDLDDFGTGYASITNIRRFSVGRIKIDRSFVTGVDRDPEQRDMVAAILTMAERLGVRTLAEGIETKGEHAALRSLGCDDAQGFEIARPMPLEETVEWAHKHLSANVHPVEIAKRTG